MNWKTQWSVFSSKLFAAIPQNKGELKIKSKCTAEGPVRVPQRLSLIEFTVTTFSGAARVMI